MFSLPRPARKARLARGGPPAGFIDDEEGTRVGRAKGDDRRLNVLRDGVRWVRAGEEGTGGDGAKEGLREEEEKGMGAVEGWSGVGGRLAIRLAISCDLLSSRN